MEDLSARLEQPSAAALEPAAVASDETLLAQVAMGDHAAFTTLYDSVSAEVYGLVRQIVVDVSAADRVTEDVLLAVWTSAASFDGSAASAHGWILGLAHRHAVDEIRGGGGGGARLSMVPAESPTEDGAAASADSAEATVGGIEQALRCLSTSQRSALELAYFQGLTYWQVARTLNMSRSSATTTLRDALLRLATPPESPC